MKHDSWADVANAVLSDPKFGEDLDAHVKQLREERDTWIRERKDSVLAAIRRELDGGKPIVDADPYSSFPSDYTGEDVGNLVSYMLSTEDNRVDPSCDFENRHVIVDGLEFGEVYGQGTYSWVRRRNVSDCP